VGALMPHQTNCNTDTSDEASEKPTYGRNIERRRMNKKNKSLKPLGVVGFRPPASERKRLAEEVTIVSL